MEIVAIDVENTKPNPDQPRKHFEGIDGLAQSLLNEGQQTPIVVRPEGDGYQIVQGERRWRAAKKAGLKTLQAEVREVSDDEAFRIGLVKNVQRSNLTPVEQAEAFAKLLDGGMTQGEVGALVGKSQSYVAQKLRLLKAPRALRVFAAENALSEGHLRQLLRFENLYPEGIMCESWLEFDPADEKHRTVEALLTLYNRLRPEDQPQLPLWMRGCIRELVEQNEHRGTLENSQVALLEYVTRHNQAIPQWIVGGWWFASAAVVFELSVSKLKAAINDWHERYQAALFHLSLHPEPPSVRESFRPHDEARLEKWWGYASDLRHSNSLDAANRSIEEILWRDGVMDDLDVDWLPFPSSMQLPSSMQPWGSNHETGE